MELQDLQAYMESEFADAKTERAAIRQDVKKTNGRVIELEKWRAFITGALFIMGAGGAAATAVLGFSL